LVGARLIAHAGSLLNLAKHPASTIQILGAEKALFRALKTKHDTPKYGLIYHASLIGQTTPKNKGKISRVLAAKTALAIRVDALGDATEATIAIENRIKVESRIRQLEGGQMHQLAGAKSPAAVAKYDSVSAKALAPPKYNSASDVIISSRKNVSERLEDAEEDATEKKLKKRKQIEVISSNEVEADEVVVVVQRETEVDDTEKKKKKKKKNKDVTDE
jgi:nucleolar protein 58